MSNTASSTYLFDAFYLALPTIATDLVLNSGAIGRGFIHDMILGSSLVVTGSRLARLSLTGWDPKESFCKKTARVAGGLLGGTLAITGIVGAVSSIQGAIGLRQMKQVERRTEAWATQLDLENSARWDVVCDPSVNRNGKCDGLPTLKKLTESRLPESVHFNKKRLESEIYTGICTATVQSVAFDAQKCMDPSKLQESQIDCLKGVVSQYPVCRSECRDIQAALNTIETVKTTPPDPDPIRSQTQGLFSWLGFNIGRTIPATPLYVDHYEAKRITAAEDIMPLDVRRAKRLELSLPEGIHNKELVDGINNMNPGAYFTRMIRPEPDNVKGWRYGHSCVLWKLHDGTIAFFNPNYGIKHLPVNDPSGLSLGERVLALVQLDRIEWNVHYARLYELVPKFLPSAKPAEAIAPVIFESLASFENK